MNKGSNIKTVITIRVEKLTDKKLQKMAKKNHRSKSAQVVHIIQQYLIDRGEQN